MDEEIERLVVSVRADTGAFARDVAAMRESLEGPFEAGVDRAGRVIEATLARAIRTGRLGFEDLRKAALQVLAEIASAAVRSGIETIFGRHGGGDGGGRGAGGGAGGLLSALAGIIGGLPGRATGGPVAPGAAYWVGERGPEIFVPTASGRIAPIAGMGPAERGAIVAVPQPSPPREVRVAITVDARGGSAPAALATSSRQVARAVKAALAGAD